MSGPASPPKPWRVIGYVIQQIGLPHRAGQHRATYPQLAGWSRSSHRPLAAQGAGAQVIAACRDQEVLAAAYA